MLTNILKNFKSDKNEYTKSLEDEILRLQETVTQQEKIITQNKNNVKSPSTLEQIKKIEMLEMELKRQRQRIENIKEIAQEAYKVKSEFLANMKEEIHTPIESISRYSEFLTHEIKDEKLNKYANAIYGTSKKLLKSVDDILLLSRLEAGNFTFDERPVNIKKMIQNIIKSRREEASKKALNLTLNIDDSLPDALMLDKREIEDIFTNLVENAIKFTNEGFVHVSLEKKGENILKNSIDFSLVVEDSGRGIKSSQKDKIFDIFEYSGEKGEGLGIGLSIHKRVAKGMNGDITFSSKEGEGSTFIFTLFEAEIVLLSATSEEEDTDSIDFSLVKPDGGTIVVVDESEEVRDFIFDAFSQTTLKILAFDNPREAIEALKETKADMILIDIETLTSDENAVLKIIEGISSAPLVTLTEKRVKDIDFRVRTSQIVGHLKKPLLKRELFKISLEVLNQR